MFVWRLTRAKHAAVAFDGEGAMSFGGRWHHRGTRVVYTSGALSLAVLEVLVNVDHDDAPSDYVSIAFEIPDDVPVTIIEPPALPKDWRRSPAPEDLQTIGSDWVRRGDSAVLRVPSAVVPTEANYLVNPTHPDFLRCQARPPTPFHLDGRLLSHRG